MLDRGDDAAVARFIEANTRLMSPPLLPELKLHLAEESLPIWKKTEEELGEMNIPPPFWAFAWAGGQAVARYILDNPDLVAGRRVLDLGSGAALGAIAAMKAGAACALAADIDTMAGPAAKLNAHANHVSLETTAFDFLASDTGTDRETEFDAVLIADVFYERDLADRITAFVARRHEAGALVLVGDPRRSYFPLSSYECLAEYKVPVTRELEDAEIKRAAVWSYSSSNTRPQT